MCYWYFALVVFFNLQNVWFGLLNFLFFPFTLMLIDAGCLFSYCYHIKFLRIETILICWALYFGWVDTAQLIWLNKPCDSSMFNGTVPRLKVARTEHTFSFENMMTNNLLTNLVLQLLQCQRKVVCLYFGFWCLVFVGLTSLLPKCYAPIYVLIYLIENYSATSVLLLYFDFLYI